MIAKEMVKLAVEALDDKKANDIRVLDISNVSSMGDYFIIADGSNKIRFRHFATLLRKSFILQVQN